MITMNRNRNRKKNRNRKMLSLKIKTKTIRKNNKILLISSNPSKKPIFKKIKANSLNLKNSLNQTKPNY